MGFPRVHPTSSFFTFRSVKIVDAEQKYFSSAKIRIWIYPLIFPYRKPLPPLCSYTVESSILTANLYDGCVLFYPYTIFLFIKSHKLRILMNKKYRTFLNWKIRPLTLYPNENIGLILRLSQFWGMKEYIEL